MDDRLSNAELRRSKPTAAPDDAVAQLAEIYEAVPERRWRPRFQFTVQTLLVATALIAVGFAFLRHVFHAMEDLPEFILRWLAGGAFIGAGLFLPFRHPFVGAAVGIAFPLFLIVLFAFAIVVSGFRG